MEDDIVIEMKLLGENHQHSDSCIKPDLENDLHEIPLTETESKKTLDIVPDDEACIICKDDESNEECFRIQPCCQIFNIHPSCFETLLDKNKSTCLVCHSPLVKPYETKTTFNLRGTIVFLIVASFIATVVLDFYYVNRYTNRRTSLLRGLRSLFVLTPCAVGFLYCNVSRYMGIDQVTYSNPTSADSEPAATKNDITVAPNSTNGYLVYSKNTKQYYFRIHDDSDTCCLLFKNRNLSQCFVDLCSWIGLGCSFFASSFFLIYGYHAEHSFEVAGMRYIYTFALSGCMMGILALKLTIVPCIASMICCICFNERKTKTINPNIIVSM